MLLVAIDIVTAKGCCKSLGMAPTMSDVTTDKKWERHCGSIYKETNYFDFKKKKGWENTLHLVSGDSGKEM